MAEGATTQDVYTYGLDMMAAALDAREKADAMANARAAVEHLDKATLRRVATMLAVESVWTVRPRRSRRELREWIERQRFAVMAHGWGSADV